MVATNKASLRAQWPLWVKSRPVQRKRSCPLYPESGHVQCNQGCLLCANSGHDTPLFEDVVGAGNQGRWDRKTEVPRRFEVDNQLEFAWLHHR
jgi:hypothetical protein